MKHITTAEDCGKYTINYNIDDLIEIYTNKLVLKVVKEDHPELYKKARKTIKALILENNKK